MADPSEKTACRKCGVEVPTLLISRVRRWCAECEKADKVSFCRNEFCGAPLPPKHPDHVCDGCKSARNAKFVSRDLFDMALKKQEERFHKLQEASLVRFNALFATVTPASGAPSTLTAQGAPVQHHRTQGDQSAALGRPPPDDVESSISIRAGSESLFRGDRRPSVSGGHQSQVTDEVQEGDSVSQTGQESVVPSGTGKEDRLEFLKIIRTVAGEVEPEEPVKEDPMARLFGESKAFGKKRSTSIALPTSEFQKDILTRHLFPKKLGSVKVGSREDISLRVKEDDYCFFRTPLPNPGLVEFISARRQADPNCKGGEEKKVIKDPQVKATEKVLFQVDQASRIGAKLAVYDQWLLTALKDSLVKDMGSIPPDSLTGRLIDELMSNSVSLMSQSCRAASLSLAERRKIYLQEMKLNKWPFDKALELPADSTGKCLFGTGTDEKGEVSTIDTIIETYAEKFKSVKVSAAAFKVPFAPVNKGNTDNANNANKGNRSGQQKRQADNSSYSKSKKQKGNSKRNSGYKPFASNTTQGGGGGYSKK